jgi:hypothetical protein
MPVNLLIDTLPQELFVNGKLLKIRSDHRTCLRIISAFESEELTGVEKQWVMLQNMYIDPLQEMDVVPALEQAVSFLNGGSIPSQDQFARRTFSFSHDSNFIFAAFQQTHGINLQQVENLHWWVFLALFMDLGADTVFCNLISLRRRVHDGKASREERDQARDLGEIFDVPEPDTRSIEERMAELQFFSALGKGQ